MGTKKKERKEIRECRTSEERVSQNVGSCLSKNVSIHDSFLFVAHCVPRANDNYATPALIAQHTRNRNVNTSTRCHARRQSIILAKRQNAARRGVIRERSTR